MNKLSDRINSLAESQTIAMSRKSRELIEQGIDVISLALGEPDFNTPDVIKEAAKKAIDDNYSHYPPVAGYLDLRKAVAKKFKEQNGLNYTPDQVVVSTGAKQSIANVVLSLINPGDEVLVPTPYWVSYLEIIKLAEGEPVLIPSTIETDFKVSAEQIEQAITPKTKMLIYSSPSNPTGSLYSKDELEKIARVISKYPDIIIVSDEIYEHINFIGKHESIGQFDFIKDQVVVINGVSKAYAMTGWRIGYMGAPLYISKACDKMQGQFTSATGSISQRAALAALEAPLEIVEDMRKQFLKRRDLMLSLLKEIPGFKLNVPLGAFYIFPEVSSLFNTSDGEVEIKNADDLCMYLLNKAHVGLVPGEAFGAPGYLRISYATSEERLTEAVRRIKSAVASLSPVKVTELEK